jgi:hypothetical protein
MSKYLVLVAIWALSVYGQNSSTPLTNETIIRLVASGVPPDTVIKTIRSADSVSFGFLPGDLELLQRYRVPDDVVKAMAAKSYGRPVPGFSQGAPAAAARPATNIVSSPQAATPPPKAFALQSHDSSLSCTYFTVVTQDKLNNVKQGLSADDVKWFQKTFAKKYPGVCYAEPAPTVPVVFYITVTPDVYHGTQVVNHTSTHSDPVSGTVTEQDGRTSQISGTVELTTTSSKAVPYSVEYGIYTLSVERRKNDGQSEVVHRFQQKGLYRTFTMWGIPIAGGGKGKHPVHAVIENAAKWVSSGGLTDPKQSAF